MRGLGGEHTPIGADGTVDISPSARYCITEAEIITALCVSCHLRPPRRLSRRSSVPLTRVMLRKVGGGRLRSSCACRVGRYKGIEQLKAAEDRA